MRVLEHQENYAGRVLTNELSFSPRLLLVTVNIGLIKF